MQHPRVPAHLRQTEGVARLGPATVGVVYYAGHGELDRVNNRGHWLPVDAETNSSANWISSIQITDVLNAMTAMEEKYGLRCANVFHAGDGNLHPLILFDANKPDEIERAEAFGFEILELCVEVGGTITGEHGVGIEKINQMCVQFSRAELDAFFAVKKAFDPPGLLNPGKAIPTLHRCAEYGRMHVHHGQMPFADLPRF